MPVKRNASAGGAPSTVAPFEPPFSVRRMVPIGGIAVILLLSVSALFSVSGPSRSGRQPEAQTAAIPRADQAMEAPDSKAVVIRPSAEGDRHNTGLLPVPDIAPPQQPPMVPVLLVLTLKPDIRIVQRESFRESESIPDPSTGPGAGNRQGP